MSLSTGPCNLLQLLRFFKVLVSRKHPIESLMLCLQTKGVLVLKALLADGGHVLTLPPLSQLNFVLSFSSDAMLWTRSAWMWSTPDSRCAPLSPTSPALASFMSSAPTSGWLLSPSRMSTLLWCSSSSTRCVMSWRPTLGRSVRRISRTTLCSSTSCWMVRLDHKCKLDSDSLCACDNINVTHPSLNGMLSCQ